MPTAGDSKKTPAAPCPQCKKTTSLGPDNGWRPFCSQRCKMLDLGEWFSGGYAVAAEEGSEGADPDQDESATLQ